MAYDLIGGKNATEDKMDKIRIMGIIINKHVLFFSFIHFLSKHPMIDMKLSRSYRS